MASLKGTRTEKNLLTAFAGESQARMRYTYFASQAKKEGYVQISAIFAETADQEKEHAKRFFKFLEGGELEISGTFPAGVIGTTLENLKGAAAGEHEEWSHMYPEFAAIAREEGFGAIALVFDMVSVAEKQHEKDSMTWAPISRQVGFLKKIPRSTGRAGTAVICIKGHKPLKCARPVRTPRPILPSSTIPSSLFVPATQQG